MKLSDDEGETMTEHIVGTHMEDLTQIYNGHVTIRGSADTSNILTNNREVSFITNSQMDPINNGNSHENIIQSQVIVNGIQFELMNVRQQYWMKKKHQVTFY